MYTYRKSSATALLTAFMGVVAALFLGFQGVAFADTSTSTATSTSSGTSTPFSIMIMKHLCNPSIKNISDFQALEANKDSIAALANTVLNCPTTGLTNTQPVAGTVASPRTTYNFQVINSMNVTKNMNTDGTFMPHKLCESDIQKDVDGNGTISASTCLDISHYEVPIDVPTNASSSSSSTASSVVRVSEVSPPAGYHFGTVRFTPTSLSQNNDSQSVTSVDTANGTINLNVATDTDKMIMLHIYNFANAATSTGTTTPPTNNPELQALIHSIQTQISAIGTALTQIQSLLMQLGTQTGGNNGGNSGYTTARAYVASPTAVIGDTDDFAGNYFKPYESVTMSLDGTILRTMNSDQEGNWRTGSIKLPTTPGQKTYVFRGLESGISIPVVVQVTPINQ